MEYCHLQTAEIQVIINNTPLHTKVHEVTLYSN